MPEQYTITVPIRIADGVWTYPRVGQMSAIRQMKTGEVIYDIALDFPVDATEFLAFAQGSGATEADERARANDPANTGPQMRHTVFPLRQRPSAEKTVPSTTDNNAEETSHD